MVRLLLFAPHIIVVLIASLVIWLFVKTVTEPPDMVKNRPDTLQRKFAELRHNMKWTNEQRRQLIEKVKEQNIALKLQDERTSQVMERMALGPQFQEKRSVIRESMVNLKRRTAELIERGKDLMRYNDNFNLERLPDFVIAAPANHQATRQHAAALGSQITVLNRFRQAFIEKAAEYSRWAAEQSSGMKQEMERLFQNFSEAPRGDGTMQVSVDQMMRQQEQIVRRFEDQRLQVALVYESIQDKIEKTRERLSDIMEQSRLRMEYVNLKSRDRREANEELISSGEHRLEEQRQRLVDAIEDRSRLLEQQRATAEALSQKAVQFPESSQWNVVRETIGNLRAYADELANEGREITRSVQLQKERILFQAGHNTARDRIADLNSRVDRLAGFQGDLLERVSRYAEKSMGDARNMRAAIDRVSQELRAVPGMERAGIDDVLRDMVSRQEEIARRVQDQRQQIGQISDETKDRIARTRERLRDAMEQNEMKLADAQSRAEQNRDLVRDRRDAAADAGVSRLHDRHQRLVDAIEDRHRMLEQQRMVAEDLTQRAVQFPEGSQWGAVRDTIGHFRDYSDQLAREGRDILKGIQLQRERMAFQFGNDQVGGRISDLNSRMDLLNSFQSDLLERASAYAEKSLGDAQDMKARIGQISQQLQGLPGIERAPLMQALDDMSVRQDQMSRQIEQQQHEIARINDEIKDRIVQAQERLRQAAEQNKMKLADARLKAQQTRDMIRDRQMAMDDLSERAQAKMDAAKQRAEDVKQMLLDRRK